MVATFRKGKRRLLIYSLWRTLLNNHSVVIDNVLDWPTPGAFARCIARQGTPDRSGGVRIAPGKPAVLASSRFRGQGGAAAGYRAAISSGAARSRATGGDRHGPVESPSVLSRCAAWVPARINTSISPTLPRSRHPSSLTRGHAAIVASFLPDPPNGRRMDAARLDGPIWPRTHWPGWVNEV